MENFDLVIGIHSIICALKNPNRVAYSLVVTEDALTEIKKSVNLEGIKVELYASHKVQEEAKKYFRQKDLEYHRVPSGAFLLCSELATVSIPEFYKALEEKEGLKILCLDQVTDVHNAAAIIRTACFYGVDFIVVPDKKSFGLTPSFFRIASGAAEYVPLVPVNKLTKVIAKLNSMGVATIALSEHAKGDLIVDEVQATKKSICIVLGREDVGISNAVLRLIENHISLKSQGEIKSLNVSIAAAVVMEKCFTKK